MFFPLGLGLRIKGIPYVTYLLVLLNCFLHYSYFNTAIVQKEISGTFYDVELIHSKIKLFERYCEIYNVDKKLCLSFYVSTLRSSPYYNYLIKKLKSKRSEFSKFEMTDLSFESLKKIKKLSEVYQRFEILLKRKDQEITKLDPYQKYFEHEKKSTFKLHRIYDENDLLSAHSFSLYNLLKAMFSHINLAHLLGNMFILFIFGRFVEARFGSVFYLGTYLLGGFLGLGGFIKLASPEENFLVGASANVFAVMGMFYIGFYHHKMKFWVFYFFSRVVSFPIKTYFILFYIVLEVLLMLGYYSNVAHAAHIIGFVIGCSAAYAWNRYYLIPKDFLYKDEFYEWKSIRQHNDERFFQEVKILLRYNPDNKVFHQEILHRVLLMEPNDIFDKNSDFVLTELPHLFKKLSEEKEVKVFTDLSLKIPIEISFIEFYSKLSQKEILFWIDSYFDSKEIILAAKFIILYIEKYPRSDKNNGLVRTLSGLIQNYPLSLEEKTTLKQIVKASTVPVINKLEIFFQEELESGSESKN